MNSPKTNLAAGILLLAMFLMMISSARNDALTFDELAHIPAGFGYLTQQDYRLNAEHPPLIKLAAAFSAELAVRPVFPTDTEPWKREIKDQWAQWDQGTIFLYQSGNNADRIIFWSRLAMILVTLFLGWLLFDYARRHFGGKVALLTLFFFAFSPTFLAHGRYVTTDVGAALGFLIGLISFLRFLKNPSWRNVLIAGVVFGIAELLKFSLILLIPIYGILWLAWVLTRPNQELRERMRSSAQLLGKIVIIGCIGLIVISAVYAFSMRRYPLDRNLRDAQGLLHYQDSAANCALEKATGRSGGECSKFRQAEINLKLLQNPLTRPLGQWALGMLLATRRTAGGNSTYYFGELSGEGYRSYFPVMFAVKEPLALIILGFLALMSAARKKLKSRNFHSIHLRIRDWVRDHFERFSFLTIIAVYWGTSIIAPLNIGIRHVLPTFPFIYLLIAYGICRRLFDRDILLATNLIGTIQNLYARYLKPLPGLILVFLLLLWLGFSTLRAYPHFLSYYNELGGGVANGYRIATDSNYDWGQDLKRLKVYVDENRIDKISVAYFGGGNLRYYFGDKAEPWWSARGPARGWFAISVNEREGAFARLAPGFERKPEDSYEWLREYQPVGRAGYSIFIYKLPE